MFCLYCLILSRYHFSLPSFASIFWLVFSSFIFHSSCRAFSVSSEYFLMFRFSILVCCRRLLSVTLVWVPTWVLTFCLWSLKGPQFFHWLFLLQHILGRLSPWCRLSGYLSISRSLSRFRTWLTSSLVLRRPDKYTGPRKLLKYKRLTTN